MRSRHALPHVPAGTNQEHARLHNRRVVLDAIRQAGQLTRAELTRLTTLSAQAVSNIIAELQREGMLLAHAPRAIPQGQPPIPFSLNPEGGFALGMHVAPHRLTSVLIDLTGQVRATRVDDVEQATLAAMRPRIQKITRALCAGVDDARLMGLGIALQAPVRSAAPDAIASTEAPAWDASAARAALAAATGLPVLIEDDASAAAVGERLYGAAKNLRDFAYLFIGRELRAVLFLANQLHAGHRHNAGRIGHLVLVPKGRPCRCGQRGCLGCYLSEACLLECLGADAGRGVDDLDPGANPRGFQHFIQGAVPALRYATGVLEAILDPEGIVVGGTLPHGILQTLVERSASATATPADAEAPQARIQLGRAGAECVALGAASTVMLAQFSSEPANVG